jgi:co-chaperonin GroES (HSP10)
MRLLGKRVGVIQLDVETRTKTGIWLPVASESSQEGIVKFVGDEVEGIEVGDRILFEKFAGLKIERSSGRPLVILNESDVLCKIEV